MPEEQKEGTEASVGTWLKGVGDAVRENEPLVEISTDKVTIEIASPASGVLSEMVKSEGEAALPGELLGRIQTDPVSGSEAEATHGSKSAPLAKYVAAAAPNSAAVDSYSPSVRRLLREHNIDP